MTTMFDLAQARYDAAEPFPPACMEDEYRRYVDDRLSRVEAAWARFCADVAAGLADPKDRDAWEADHDEPPELSYGDWLAEF